MVSSSTLNFWEINSQAKGNGMFLPNVTWLKFAGKSFFGKVIEVLEFLLERGTVKLIFLFQILIKWMESFSLQPLYSRYKNVV